MRFPTPLIPARLLRRYKRFLADAVLDDGREITAHCPNPGAMLGLQDPGMRIWLEPNDDPRKKLRYGWRLAELEGGHMAGIDTNLPNRLVADALAGAQIPALAGYEMIRPEQRYGRNSRIDFLLSAPGREDAYIEVKNVHLRRTAEWAEFPDCVTARGTKHLGDLIDVAQSGARAVMLYVVQRSDCARFRLASDLDPAYAAAFDAARAAGVEVLCHATDITTQGVSLSGEMLVDPTPQTGAPR